MLAGHRTWVFEQKPVIISTGTVGGPFEADGAISEDFDLLSILIYPNGLNILIILFSAINF